MKTPWPPDDAALPLVRYLTGELSEREEIELLRALDRDPELRRTYEELRTMWERSGVPKHGWDARAALARIKHPRPIAAPRPVRMPEPRPLWSPLRIAAGIALVLGVGMLWRAVGTPRGMPGVTQVAGREFSTPRGQRAAFQLSDGTRLILAADSRLRVPADYGRGVREVALDGEALFEVVHDATRPFRVKVKDAVVEDLGTRFDVRAYAGDPVVAVAVAEGMVALGPAEASQARRRAPGEVPQGIVLRRGEVGTLAPSGQVTTATGDVLATYLTWTEGRLRFYRTPLGEVARAVSRWYDLDVKVEGPALAALPITAEFGVQSADELLQELALAADVRISRSGKVVTLQPKP